MGVTFVGLPIVIAVGVDATAIRYVPSKTDVAVIAVGFVMWIMVIISSLLFFGVYFSQKKPSMSHK